MKAEASAAVSAVSVSTAEAKREKTTNALNKKIFGKKKNPNKKPKTKLVFSPSSTEKNIPQERSII